MTLHEWLQTAAKHLEFSGIPTARLDCLVLLEDATSKDRAWLLAHPETPLQGSTLKRLDAMIEKRMGHEPLAYIRGKTEFYGREFIINKDVLVPRPESETMIDLLKGLLTNPQKPPLLEDGPLTDGGDAILVVDVGTGSGALAITAKLELPNTEVIATDIDPNCLKVVRRNAKKHNTDIKIFRGDLLQPLSALGPQPSVLLCNLPYVPNDHKINKAASNEPSRAIFGGYDGLGVYRQLFLQLQQIKLRVQYVFTESLSFQHKELVKIAKKADYKQIQEEDFIQVFQKN